MLLRLKKKKFKGNLHLRLEGPPPASPSRSCSRCTRPHRLTRRLMSPLSETAARLNIDHQASVTQTLREPICQGDRLFCSLRRCVSGNAPCFAFIRSGGPERYRSGGNSRKEQKKQPRNAKRPSAFARPTPAPPRPGLRVFFWHPAKLKPLPGCVHAAVVLITPTRGRPITET